MSSNKIQLFSLATPNGQKVAIALEELGLEYDAHTINIMKNEQFAPEFLKVSPNNRIPAITDPNGPNGKSLDLFESGAILLYLAEKTGKLIPTDPYKRAKTIQWLFWQMGGLGPMFGQFGHFHKYAKEKIPYAIDRYRNEARRLLGVLDKQLSENEYVAGDEYTIADISIFPWVNCIDFGYKAWDVIGVDEFKNVTAWLKKCNDRPATKKGVVVTPFN
ncbi:hypothetical protein PROFUN_00458 [Planoprotostelium fungivorum]|uniref:Glutathione S-transferase n=1 Tax=Planoprotostelium fungivorum TaxID=1890364 RepID=A0A2P6N0V1_9EUKA|nr:hypothetical protein PROFUN_00458 [Planoprotostelium fungivorum]